MSKSKTIEQKSKELKSREERVMLELNHNGDDLKTKAIQVGKIALISGLVVLAGYWTYKAFFTDDQGGEVVKKKKKKKNKKIASGLGLGTRLSALATPYITNFLGGLLEIDSTKEKKED